MNIENGKPDEKWSSKPSVVEAQAIAIPEHANGSQDCLFAHQTTTQRIIAVFDHSEEVFAQVVRRKQKRRMAAGVLLFLAFFILVIVLYYLWIFPFCGLLVCWAVIAKIKRQITIPRTAVTSGGVIHFDKNGIKYFFPLVDILNIAGTGLTVSGDVALKLDKDVRAYQEHLSRLSCTCRSNRWQYTISGMQDPVLFQKTVLALKKQRGNADEGSEGPEIAGALDKDHGLDMV
ncbi:hypothetical protein MPSEU_000760000 [Mayamaea pseudoterrestris]|nr:hypothetical protein MPSEU_000760000 [Mayamaea pseudoterrestris]